MTPARVLSLCLAVWAMVSGPGASQPSGRIILTAERTLVAGAPWSLTVTVDGGQPGDIVAVVLFNGLQTLAETLTLGSGGVARWDVPFGHITQAGDSLLIASTPHYQVRRILQVSPQSVAAADLLTTDHNLPAEGAGGATILALPRDEWGNAPADGSALDLTVRYPTAPPVTQPFVVHTGLGYLDLTSQGPPGRVRLSLPGLAVPPLELNQTAGRPAGVALALLPTCVLDDGRDRLVLAATVTDAAGYPVGDGTLVRFTWVAGFGVGRTVDGQASLRIPAPDGAGVYTYRAWVDGVQSAPARLVVTAGACADE